MSSWFAWDQVALLSSSLSLSVGSFFFPSLVCLYHYCYSYGHKQIRWISHISMQMVTDLSQTKKDKNAFAAFLQSLCTSTIFYVHELRPLLSSLVIYYPQHSALFPVCLSTSLRPILRVCYPFPLSGKVMLDTLVIICHTLSGKSITRYLEIWLQFSPRRRGSECVECTAEGLE